MSLANQPFFSGTVLFAVDSEGNAFMTEAVFSTFDFMATSDIFFSALATLGTDRTAGATTGAEVSATIEVVGLSNFCMI